MFSTDNHAAFAIEAQKLGVSLGIQVVIDWQNEFIDFQGDLSDDNMKKLLDGLQRLNETYGGYDA